MSDSNQPVVLVVDDDEKVVETFSLWLDDAYDLRTATSGAEALARLDADVDVVLLDRLMPGMSGDEVLAAIDEHDADPAVAVVTAVEPDVDVAAMPFDTYLTKTLDREKLVGTLEHLLDRRDHDRTLREHFALAEKLAAIEAYNPPAELAENDAYQRLREEFEDVDDRLLAQVSALDDEDLNARMRDLKTDQ